MQRWATSAILFLLLSGCSGSGGSGGDPAGSGVDGDGDPLGKAMAVLTNGLAQPIHRTIWANGTVAFQDTCNTGACIFGSERVMHVTEVEVARDIPVSITVDLAFEPSAVTFGSFETWVQADATFYRYTYAWEPGAVHVETTLLPTSSVEVVMAAFGPGGEVPETDYTLSIRVDADPQLVPPGVPVAVRLGPGDNLSVDSGSASHFVLYGPDDSLVGHYQDTLALPEDAADGEYVVLIPPGTSAGTISSDGGDSNMTTLGLRYVEGDMGILPPNGAYDADFEVTGYPLGVGVEAGVSPGATGTYGFFSSGFSMRLTGPNGLELDSGVMCQICFTFGGFQTGMSTESGDQRVEAGTYSIHAQTDATYEAYIVPFAIYLQRLG